MYRPFLLIPLCTIFLFAKQSDMLEFVTIAAPDFSIELKDSVNDPFSTNFLMCEFDSNEVKKNNKRDTKIGTIYLVISDLMEEVRYDRVYIMGTTVSNKGEFEIAHIFNQRETLVVTSDRNSSGKKKKTELTSGSLVREISPGEKISPPEAHKITVSAKKGTLEGKASGLYEGQILFVAVSNS